MKYLSPLLLAYEDRMKEKDELLQTTEVNLYSKPAQVLYWIYYHGLIRHTNMNQIPGSIRFHLSQMRVIDSTGILLNPRYFTVRECSWGISNKQEKSNGFLLCFPHFMHFNHILEARMCLLFTGRSAKVTRSCRGGNPGKWETAWWHCKDGRIQPQGLVRKINSTPGSLFLRQQLSCEN